MCAGRWIAESHCGKLVAGAPDGARMPQREEEEVLVDAGCVAHGRQLISSGPAGWPRKPRIAPRAIGANASRATSWWFGCDDELVSGRADDGAGDDAARARVPIRRFCFTYEYSYALVLGAGRWRVHGVRAFWDTRM